MANVHICIRGFPGPRFAFVSTDHQHVSITRARRAREHWSKGQVVFCVGVRLLIVGIFTWQPRIGARIAQTLLGSLELNYVSGHSGIVYGRSVLCAGNGMMRNIEIQSIIDRE